MSRLDQHVAGVQNRLILERVLRILAWSFLLLAGVIAIHALITWQFSFPLHRSVRLLLAASVLTTILAIIAGLWIRPSAQQAAVFIDTHLALNEKFSTALYARSLNDPFASAAVLDAERTADNVSLRNRFPVAWPRSSWLTILATVLALLLTWLLPEYSRVEAKVQTAKKIELEHSQTVKAERSVRQALVELDAAPKAVADAEGVKLAKQELTDLLKKPITDAAGAQKKAETALQQMNDVKQQIQEQQNFASRLDANAFKEMMPSADEKGPVAEAQRDLAKGDMTKAVEDIKQAVDKFDKMPEKDKEQAAKQMENLAKQVAQQANDPKVQQQIQKQLQQMGATQQQAQQMAQQMQLAANGNQAAQQQLQQMAKQISQQQNAQQGGSSQQQQQRAQAMQQAMQQMQQSANGQAQSQQLSQAASQLAQAMRQGIPVGQGAGQQASAGQQSGAQQGASPGQQGSQPGNQGGQQGSQPGQQGSQPGQQGAQPGQGSSQQQQMAAAGQTMQQQLQQMQAMAKDGQAVSAGQQDSQSGADGSSGQQASSGNQPGQQGQNGQNGNGSNGQNGQGSNGQSGGAQPGNSGQWAQGGNQNPQPGQGGAGGNGHGGARPDPAAAPFGVKQELSQSQTNESGKILASSFVKAPSDKGKSNIKLSQELVKEEQEATDEVEQDRIPRSAQNAVKDYFQTLKDDAK